MLEGRAQRGEVRELHLRVAEHQGALYLDLGDPTGRCARIEGEGWRMVQDVPVLFRRTELTAPLHEPQMGGRLEELWDLLNVRERDRPLLLAWLVSALMPGVPHPILVLRGEQGTGKSTAEKLLAALIDPSPAQTRKPPKNAETWVIAASGSWVVPIDNVSAVPDWWSDSLCRAVTGDGDVRRRLYTDAGLSVHQFRRVVILNGIDLGAIRDDLAERLLIVELARISDAHRRFDADLSAEWNRAQPRVLGALLDLTAAVLDRLPRLQLGQVPRMADFYKVLAGVDAVTGSRAALDYIGQADTLAADALDSEPVLARLNQVISTPFTGSSGTLLKLITPEEAGWRAPQGWPKDPRALTALLRRRGPTLRRLGWGFEDLGRSGKAGSVQFQLVPPSGRATAGDEAGDASAGQAVGTLEQAPGAIDTCPSPRLPPGVI